MMFKTLSIIGKALAEENVLWGVGASLVLHRHGMVEKPNDIDLMISLKDIHRAEVVFNRLGEKKPVAKFAPYTTEYFYEYVVQGVEVDVMAGFGITHNQGAFEYLFDEASVTETALVEGSEIPFTSLEEWYVLYQLIPNREPKVKMIETYLLANGVKHPQLLERALQGELPNGVREKVKRILGR